MTVCENNSNNPKILNLKTNKCIKYASPYFKKLLKEQLENGENYFKTSDLKRLKENKSPTVKTPEKTESKSPTVKTPEKTESKTKQESKTKPDKNTVVRGSRHHIVSKNVQKKLRAYVSDIKEKKVKELKKTIDDFCYRDKLIDLPFVHDKKTVIYSYYSFVNLSPKQILNKEFFHSYNTRAFKKKYVKLTEPYDFYRNNFNHFYVNSENLSENVLDVEWFNEMNKYISSLSKKDLIILNTYTLHGDKIINLYLRHMLDPDKYITEITENFVDRIKFQPSYQTNQLFPLAIPLMSMIDEMSKTMSPTEMVHELFSDFNDEKVFNEFIKEHKFSLESHESRYNRFCLNFVSIKYLKSINYARYYRTLIAIMFLNKKHFINVLDAYKDSIQRIISNAPKTKKVMHLYRGTEGDVTFSQKKGEFFKNKGFVSTTNKYSVANQFIDSTGCCITIITVLPGSSVVWMGGLSQFPNECEFLLGTNTTYLIRSSKDVFIPYNTNNSNQDTICRKTYAKKVKVMKVVAL